MPHPAGIAAGEARGRGGASGCRAVRGPSCARGLPLVPAPRKMYPATGIAGKGAQSKLSVIGKVIFKRKNPQHTKFQLWRSTDSNWHWEGREGMPVTRLNRNLVLIFSSLQPPHHSSLDVDCLESIRSHIKQQQQQQTKLLFRSTRKHHSLE